jgi:NitT/TauT family transport system permease protein
MNGGGAAGERLLARVVSFCLLGALWQLAAAVSHSRTLPGPAAVVSRLGEEIVGGAMAHHLGITLFRVSCAFVLSLVGGAILGIALGRWRRLDAIFDGWLIGFVNLPALVIIVLAYIWLGMNETAAIIAVALNKLPATAILLREGTRALDPQLALMARAFRFGLWKGFRHVILPQLTPYLLGASRSGLALIWKVVLVAEILGRSDGVGFQIEVCFQLFDVTGILAYAIAFGLVVLGFEWLLLQPFERRMNRWRLAS